MPNMPEELLLILTMAKYTGAKFGWKEIPLNSEATLAPSSVPKPGCPSGNYHLIGKIPTLIPE